jgi:16S rRNA (adenine1518-N6/adenine1519-N6)-dimethyltransferase
VRRRPTRPATDRGVTEALPGPRAPRPRKRFGQHFLVPTWARKVVDAVNPQPNQTLVEIGPGRGAITRLLAARSAAVVAIEIDRDLTAALRDEAIAGLTIVEGDVLRLDIAALDVPHGARLVGNLPYNISSPVLFHLLEAQRRTDRFGDATLMLQKEVADRLVAAPGTRDYGPLSIAVALQARVVRLLVLPPTAFHPPPKVTSAVVRLTFLTRAERPIVPPTFMPMIRALFSARRKTIANGLKGPAKAAGLTPAAILAAAGIPASARAEQLTVAQLLSLAGQLEVSAAHGA